MIKTIKALQRHINIMSVIPKGKRAMVESSIGRMIILLAAILLGLGLVLLAVPSIRAAILETISMMFSRDGFT